MFSFFFPAFLSWDVDKCHVSLEKELLAITGQSPEGEEARYGRYSCLRCFRLPPPSTHGHFFDFLFSFVPTWENAL